MKSAGRKVGVGSSLRRQSHAVTLVLITAIVLVSLTLRGPITAVGPLVDTIRSDTGLSAAASGLLTTLPILVFAVASPVIPALSRRLGIELVLFGSAVALTVGILFRWIPGIVPLFVGTLVIGAAIALANVLLPALVKREFPARQGVMTALYSTVLSAGAALGSGISVPLSDIGLGWGGALAIWAIPSAFGALVWLIRIRGRGAPGSMAVPEPAVPMARPRKLWRSPLAWRVTLFWGVQSIAFYTTIAWMPAILTDLGIEAQQAGFLLLISQVAGLAITLAVPPLAERHPDQRGIVAVGMGLVLAGGSGLLVFGGSGALAWVVLIGLGEGVGVSIALMLFVLRSKSHETAAELSGMSQTVGYAISACGPVAAGAVYDFTGGWTPVIAGIMATGVIELLLIAGTEIGTCVEDE